MVCIEAIVTILHLVAATFTVAGYQSIHLRLIFPASWESTHYSIRQLHRTAQNFMEMQSQRAKTN